MIYELLQKVTLLWTGLNKVYPPIIIQICISADISIFFIGLFLQYWYRYQYCADTVYGTAQRQRRKRTQLFAIYERVSSVTSAF